MLKMDRVWADTLQKYFNPFLSSLPENNEGAYWNHIPCKTIFHLQRSSTVFWTKDWQTFEENENWGDNWFSWEKYKEWASFCDFKFYIHILCVIPH